MSERDDAVSARLTIAPLQPYTSAEELDELCPGDEEIFACDFYVTGAEDGVVEPGGLRLGRILNVDHHAPIARMEDEITSTMLAAEYLVAGGELEPDRRVVIHHTDCDSMLSSAMMLGILPPDPDLVNASVCADHTGAAHPSRTCSRRSTTGVVARARRRSTPRRCAICARCCAGSRWKRRRSRRWRGASGDARRRWHWWTPGPLTSTRSAWSRSP
jgi:hypothetical protein